MRFVSWVILRRNTPRSWEIFPEAISISGKTRGTYFLFHTLISLQYTQKNHIYYRSASSTYSLISPHTHSSYYTRRPSLKNALASFRSHIAARSDRHVSFAKTIDSTSMIVLEQGVKHCQRLGNSAAMKAASEVRNDFVLAHAKYVTWNHTTLHTSQHTHTHY